MTDRLVNLQLLRIFAALAVVLYHVKNHAGTFDKSFNPQWFGWGHAGVDVFFVISGFIMVYITRKGTMKPGEFILRRFARVWPLYLIVTIAAALIAAYAPLFYKGDTTLSYVIKSAVFIPAARSFDHQYFPLVGQGWTLNVEIAFYSLFGLALAFRKSDVALVCLIGALMGLGMVSGVPELSFYATAGHGILLEFLFGVLLGRLYLSGAKIPAPLAWSALAAGLALIVFPVSGPRFLMIGGPAFLIVAGALYVPAPKSKQVADAFDVLGLTSYALYLTHVFVLSAFRRVLLLEHAQMHWAVYIVIATALSVVLATAVYLMIEKPIEKRLKPLVALRFQRVNLPVQVFDKRQQMHRQPVVLDAIGNESSTVL